MLTGREVLWFQLRHWCFCCGWVMGVRLGPGWAWSLYRERPLPCWHGTGVRAEPGQPAWSRHRVVACHASHFCFYFPFFFFFFVLLHSVYPRPWVLFCFHFSPSSHQEDSEQMAAWCEAATSLNHKVFAKCKMETANIKILLPNHTLVFPTPLRKWREHNKVTDQNVFYTFSHIIVLLLLLLLIFWKVWPDFTSWVLGNHQLCKH